MTLRLRWTPFGSQVAATADRERRSKMDSSVKYIRVFPSEDGEQWFYEPRGGNNETLSVSEEFTREHDAVRAAEDAYPGVEVRVDPQVPPAA